MREQIKNCWGQEEEPAPVGNTGKAGVCLDKGKCARDGLQVREKERGVTTRV